MLQVKGRHPPIVARMPINLETIPRPTPISVLSKMHAHFSYRWSHIGVVIFFDGKLILSGGDLNWPMLPATLANVTSGPPMPS